MQFATQYQPYAHSFHSTRLRFPFASSYSSSFAQIITQTIRGTITEKVTHIPLPGVTVVLEGSQPLRGTTTVTNGSFRLPNIPIGRPIVRITMVGYEPVRLSNLVLTSAKEFVLSVEFEQRAISGNEIEVVAKKDKDRPLNELSLVSARTFSVDEAQRYVGNFGDSARVVTDFAVNVLAGKEIAVGKSKQNTLILSIRAVATGGMWDTPIDLEASRQQGAEVRDELNAYSEQLRPYARTDIRIGFRKNKKRYTEEYGFNVHNVFNRQNIFSRSYNPITGTITEDNQVGIFPMALYRVTF